MKDKVVIVTGGTSGIGKALAFQFGRNGSKIVVTGRKEGPLEETKSELESAGIQSLAIRSDVTVEEDVKIMVKKTINHFDTIDILINNAGISMRAIFEDVDLDVIHKVMEINFFGAVNATKYALPYIIKSKGSVIGISSIAGYRGLPGRVGYSASKFALQGFLEVLRTEMIYKGVHVLTACPGFTSSNIRKTALSSDGTVQGESPREEDNMMSAEECAARIYKATKKRKKILTLTAQGKMTVLLNKLFPGFMDKIVYKAMAKEPGSPFSVPGK
jgi:short-subunit dehydrogenase